MSIEHWVVMAEAICFLVVLFCTGVCVGCASVLIQQAKR